MEQTTLQQRIEERAKAKLLKDLLSAAEKESSIIAIVGTENYAPQIDVREHYDGFNYKTSIRLYNEYAKQLFEKLLPKYIQETTDELLQKIDEMSDLLVNKDLYAPAD